MELTAGQETLVTKLTPIVRKLTPKAKQAMFAAARHSMIARGSWNHCAFNAAGKVVASKNVDSFDKAASAFGMHAQNVSNFIHIWDGSRSYLKDDKQATEALIHCIEKVGLFTTNKLNVKVVRNLVHKNKLEKEKEDFEAIVKDVDLNSDDTFSQEVADMAALLNNA